MNRDSLTVARISGLACLCLLFSMAGCGHDSGLDAGPRALPFTLAPDFSIQDVNPSSGTYLTNVSPRDHLGRVTAWYFGSAT